MTVVIVRVQPTALLSPDCKQVSGLIADPAFGYVLPFSLRIGSATLSRLIGVGWELIPFGPPAQETCSPDSGTYVVITAAS